VKILDRLPFDTAVTTVDSSCGPLEIRPFQIVVWVRIGTSELFSRPFPTVLDTGMNHNLSIREAMLEPLTGIRPDQFEDGGHTKVLNEEIPLKFADVYLEPNIRGERVLSGKPSYRLNTPRGIMLPRGRTPRIPLLGIRALVASGLRLVIDGRRKVISVDKGRCCESLRG
jgi:hypothetical protein